MKNGQSILERVGINGEEVSLFGMQKLCVKCLIFLEVVDAVCLLL